MSLCTATAPAVSPVPSSALSSRLRQISLSVESMPVVCTASARPLWAIFAAAKLARLASAASYCTFSCSSSGGGLAAAGLSAAFAGARLLGTGRLGAASAGHAPNPTAPAAMSAIRRRQCRPSGGRRDGECGG